MGMSETDFVPNGGMDMTLPQDICVIANADAIAQLRGADSAGQFAGVSLVALDAGAVIPADVIGRASVLVIEINPDDKASARRIAQVRDARPDLPLIVALHDTNVGLVRTLVRQGVTDVAVLPFAHDELLAQLLDASATIRQRASGRHLAPMVTFARSTGGCGTTTVITHVAHALSQASGGEKRICVVDLDLQSGDVASFVGQNPHNTVADLLAAGDRLDGELLRSTVCDSGKGFWLIAAPDAITPLESVDTDSLLRLLSLVRREFDYVLVDLPADWTSWALSVALNSNQVLLVTEMSIASLRQGRKRLDLLASVGIDRANLRIVVNKVERRLFKTIGISEVSEALGTDVLASLSSEGSAISAAQDQGLLLAEVKHKSRFCGDVADLAANLVTGGD
jgi:pilus assembly protein CpaE